MAGVAMLTGATGFLGSHLLAQLLETDPDGQIICLARRRGAAARDRVFQALGAARHDQGAGPVPAEWQKRVLVFEEDLCSPSDLLSPEAVAAIQALRPREFWHCAASVQFTETSAGEVWDTNVNGLQRTLELAGSVGVSIFNHVSTAYVAGTLSGRI